MSARHPAPDVNFDAMHLATPGKDAPNLDKTAPKRALFSSPSAVAHNKTNISTPTTTDKRNTRESKNLMDRHMQLADNEQMGDVCKQLRFNEEARASADAMKDMRKQMTEMQTRQMAELEMQTRQMEEMHRRQMAEMKMLTTQMKILSTHMAEMKTIIEQQQTILRKQQQTINNLMQAVKRMMLQRYKEELEQEKEQEKEQEEQEQQRQQEEGEEQQEEQQRQQAAAPALAAGSGQQQQHFAVTAVATTVIACAPTAISTAVTHAISTAFIASFAIIATIIATAIFTAVTSSISTDFTAFAASAIVFPSVPRTLGPRKLSARADRRQAALQRQEREREDQQWFEQLRHREPKDSGNERARRFDISLERSEPWGHGPPLSVRD